MSANLPVIAGLTSTPLFIIEALPMLAKALRTRDLTSYSLSHLLLMNLGNVMRAIYVYSLPPGPIWGLHTFWLVATGLMLIWYLKYEWLPRRHQPGRARRSGLAVGA